MGAPIGAGGMGEVCRARDTRLDRTVAIKVLPSEVAGDPDLRTRFEREARAVAALDHPDICGIYDVGETNGTPLPRHAASRGADAGRAPETTHGMILGTVQYMAPEQVEGKEAGARSDIWAMYS